MDFESLRARGSNLGTGAMIVISEGTGIVKRVAEYERFFAHSSCGQCNSCKVGTATMSRLLDRIDTGRGTAADLATLENLCAMLPGSGRCHLINGAVQLLQRLHHFPTSSSRLCTKYLDFPAMPPHQGHRMKEVASAIRTPAVAGLFYPADPRQLAHDAAISSQAHPHSLIPKP